MLKQFILFFITTTSSVVLYAQQAKQPVIKEVSFPKDTLSIVSAGARSGGQFLNSDAINSAISTTSERGGGVVLIPSGLWLTGPIEMKSNVNLHITRDAVLLFTTDFDAYKLVESNWEGQPAWRNQNPISGRGLENIAITGAGIIDGNGGAWRMVKKSKMTDAQWKNLVSSGGVVDEKAKIWYPSEGAYKGALLDVEGKIWPGMPAAERQEIKDYLRPNLLVFTSCKKVLIEGVTIQNSPAWNVHPLMCEDLTIRRVSIRNPWYAQNGDGLDLESCRNVMVEDCTLDVGDDAICIKSGRDKAGRDRGMPTENVIIRNNIVYHAHGGFVIGSEMSGGARNIWVEDCTFIGTDIGLRFKTTRGRGGVVENIFIKNINMVNIPGEAILFDMYYATRDIASAAERKIPVTEETPRFQNFYISNISVQGAEKGIFFRGLPEMHIKNINITDATIEANHGVDIIEASNISLKNVALRASKSTPLISIENSNNVQFENLTVLNNTTLLFGVKGETTDKISISRSNLTNVKEVGLFENGALKKVLTVTK